MAWARKKGTPYVDDPVFRANFLSDFITGLPDRFRDSSIDEMGFSEIERFIEEEKARKNDPVWRKKLSSQRKSAREKLREQFGLATIDGRTTPIANWMVEPAGIFMGRGAHPLRGRWKPRIVPKDVTLNLDEGGTIPPGEWGGVVHDQDSMWIARWVDRLTNKEKYVWLSDESHLRQQRDRAKYDNAAGLSKHIDQVRELIRRRLDAENPQERTLATVAYLIDKLAMRVGDEKDADEADTVGATTLRVEHIRFTPEEIRFDFFGKDYVRWEKALLLNQIDPLFHRNLSELTRLKNRGDLIFTGITSNLVNRFLGRAMPRLTAKVFRTFHATESARRYLNEHDRFTPDSSIPVKLYRARLANLQAAIHCNHVRTPPKNWEASLQRKEERLAKAKVDKPKSERAVARLKERVMKLTLEIDLVRRTKTYNLSTSLRNYIDPRIYKAWSEHVGLDWQLLYTKALQRKFAWVNHARVRWETPSVQLAEPLASV